MEEPFILEVAYRNTLHELPAQLQVLGYRHRFIVTLPHTDIWFEQDEDGAYRALLPDAVTEKEAGQLDKEFLEAIAATIEKVLR